MSHIVIESIDRIDLGKGEYIGIKNKMTVGDYDRIDTLSEAEDGQGRIVASLVVNIKEWNLKDDDGKQIALTPEAIESLDVDTATRIFTEIGKRNQVPKKVPASMRKSTRA